jgi:SEC-C motif-containing protein
VTDTKRPPPPRAEEEVFSDLERLCAGPGFIHALAYLQFANNFLGIGDTVDPESLLDLYSSDRLIRTETSTLIGLWAKGPRDQKLPRRDVIQDYIDRTNTLLEELHRRLSADMMSSILTTESLKQDRPTMSGLAWREPIFYGGESAYSFQYRDLATPKYGHDNGWLAERFGFTIEDATAVVAEVCGAQERALLAQLETFRSTTPAEWTLFPGFIVEVATVTESCGLAAEIVQKVLDAFSFDESTGTDGFRTLSDFNLTDAKPLIRVSDSQLLLLQPYQLVAALYESPYYWMCADEEYLPTAGANRGNFAEAFAYERLCAVFGPERTFRNVEVVDSKGAVVDEIDVLVVFADRAILLQAKSKKLTIEARKGNDSQLRDDFRMAIQSAYDQAVSCAGRLNDSGFKLRDGNSGVPITIPEISRVYPFCLVAEHYPALTVQAAHFLNRSDVPLLAEPFVTDVFFLDVLTELLDTPLQFLSYINRRAELYGQITAASEFPLLGYHLGYNLWMSDDADFIQLAEDLASNLDLAMMVRREGVPGPDTPDGILTRLKGLTLSRILNEIADAEEPAAVDIGFLLLTLSENAYGQVSRYVDQILSSSARDGTPHDFSFGCGNPPVGLTIHSNDLPPEEAAERLHGHSSIRKYATKADQWYGLCLDSRTGGVKLGGAVTGPWVHDAVMDQIVARLPKSAKIELKNGAKPTRESKRQPNVGRNEPCPCGSGRKHKRCCLNKR